jgi:hypothetical protein
MADVITPNMPARVLRSITCCAYAVATLLKYKQAMHVFDLVPGPETAR